MKKISALLLAIAMVASVTACSKQISDKMTELDRGLYEVMNEDEEIVGYIDVKRSDIVVFDENGEEDDEYEYELDDKKLIYLVDGDEAFYVENDGGELWLVDMAEDESYILRGIDDEDMPAGKEEDKDQQNGDSNAGTSDDTQQGGTADGGEVEDPAQVAVEYENLGYYSTYAVYENGEVAGYLDTWDTSFDIYDADGTYVTCDFVSDETGRYTLTNVNGDTMEMAVYREDGELRFCYANDFNDYCVLEEMDYYDLPIEWTWEDTVYTEIGCSGDIWLTSYMPVPLYKNMTYNYDGEMSELTAEYADDLGGVTTVAVSVAPAVDDSGAAVDIEGLKALIIEEFDAMFTSYEVSEETVAIGGADWYIRDYAGVENGVAIPMTVAGAIYEGQVTLFMCIHVGNDASNEAYFNAMVNWLGSFMFEY